MDDDIVRAAGLRMLGQIDNHVHVLVRAGHDRLRLVTYCRDSQIEHALALVNRHGEEFALLSRDEKSVNTQIVNPVVDILAKAAFIDRSVLIERRVCRSPDTAHRSARIGLGVLTVIFHRNPRFGAGHSKTRVFLIEPYFLSFGKSCK